MSILRLIASIVSRLFVRSRLVGFGGRMRIFGSSVFRHLQFFRARDNGGPKGAACAEVGARRSFIFDIYFVVWLLCSLGMVFKAHIPNSHVGAQARYLGPILLGRRTFDEEESPIQ